MSQFPSFIENASTSVANTAAQAGEITEDALAQAQAEGMQKADELARQAVEQGKQRLEEQRRQGVQVVQDINKRALAVANEYANKLQEDAERYEAMGIEARERAEEILKRIQFRYQQALARLDQVVSANEDLQNGLRSAAASSSVGSEALTELADIHKTLTEELTEFGDQIKAFAERWGQEIVSGTRRLYEQTLAPVVEWFQAEVFTPIFGEEPGVFQNISDWVTQNQKQLKELAQAASIFLGVFRLGLQFTNIIRGKQNRCIDNSFARDFDFQFIRWQSMMAAAKGDSTRPGLRLPIYDHVFRHRRLQAFTLLPTAQIGECNVWEGGLKLEKVDCPGIGTGDYYRPTNPVWHFIGDTKRKQIADIWQEMRWDEYIPRDCREGPYLDDSGLLNQRGRFASTARWNERYQLDRNGSILITEYEGWPRISLTESRGIGRPFGVNVPYPSGSGELYLGWDAQKGIGQCLPEIPLTMADQIPLLYLAFWFAPSTSGATGARLIRAYEKVLTRWQDSANYSINGWRLKPYGELQPPNGEAWGRLRKIDTVPLLLDTPLTTQLFMGTTTNVQKATLFTSIANSLVGLDQAEDPRTQLLPKSYVDILEKVHNNRGTKGLLETRKTQKAKSPLIETSVKWANAILAGSGEAGDEAAQLIAKVNSGNASEDEVKMLNALQVAMYGTDNPVPARFGGTRLRLE